MRQKIAVLIVLLLVLPVLGCYSVGGGDTKGWTDMSPMEKSTYAMAVYNRQYEDYMSQVGYNQDATGAWVAGGEVDLSEDQKEMLRSKKDILSNLYSAIQLYKGQMQFGNTPSPETEQEIYDLLNRLQ
jgi:hypothetical protein